jgi:hypothetical protein
MQVVHDNASLSRSGQVGGPTPRPASYLVRSWARGRRQITPWAYPRLRALAAVRLIVGIFLAGLGAVMISSGYSGIAALPLVFAAVHFSIAYLDITVARSAPPRT